jgi:WD40 repeat protein
VFEVLLAAPAQVSGKRAHHSARIWEVETGKELGRWKGHVGDMGGVAISPDDKFASSGADDTSICLWRLPG